MVAHVVRCCHTEIFTQAPWLQAMRPEVQQAAPVQLVLRLRCAMADNDYVAFFHLMRRAPYLLACLAHAYFPAVRAAAFGAICTGTYVPLSLSPASSLCHTLWHTAAMGDIHCSPRDRQERRVAQLAG